MFFHYHSRLIVSNVLAIHFHLLFLAMLQISQYAMWFHSNMNFFLRIARCFPLLQVLDVLNCESQSQISNNQLYSIVEYSHLILLRLSVAHTDYVEQFLNKTKTHLPRLTKLAVYYDQLRNVTKNFTRDITRLNCA
jgi:hypothetical protein